MIFVAGGTGRLGSIVVRRLVQRGERVRMLTRTPGTAPVNGCEVAVGDVRNHAAVAAALEGCDTAVWCVHGLLGGRGAGPDQIDRAACIATVDAAQRAGVRRFVLVSIKDAAPDHTSSLFRAKYAAEQHLRATGLDWTILRPTCFLELWLDIVRGRLGTGGPAVVLGPGENLLNVVSVVDVAAVVDHCLIEPSTIRRVLDVAGPRERHPRRTGSRSGRDCDQASATRRTAGDAISRRALRAGVRETGDPGGDAEHA
ncbi:NADH dehydrogenase [Kribbella aluminosa]|uniref:NADH dehydrogenase n=1 Tax=Kribbella aluminosa TaxID=416017 RepID=A0ABS4UMS0_9ACTN|nr:NAD(P)H-binding protein [Kribbella aluminosa]MBP2352943.1 NADH dehydrogenase [Kribbella aluminosa]